MSDGITAAAARAKVMAKQATANVEVEEVPRWQPWIDFQEKPDLLPIEGPPCKTCAFWMPIRRYHPEYKTYVGVQLCHAQEMRPDFGCHAPKVP